MAGVVEGSGVVKGGSERKGEIVDSKVSKIDLKAKANEDAKDSMEGEEEENFNATEVENAV